MCQERNYWIVALTGLALFFGACSDGQQNGQSAKANVVEIVTFKLREGASVDAFRTANQNVEDGHVSKQPGFISRKTARNEEGWLVVVEWEDVESAELSMQSFADAPATKSFMEVIDPASMRMQRFTDAQ